MTVITLRLSEEVLVEMNSNAKLLDMTRADYLREAINRFNRSTRKKWEREILQNASLKVRADSMRINAEFSLIEGDGDA